uniref:Uncharacterized protein n=1 Tax=Oryza sativa subsp. japonica TaxID=39947 RepID=Q67V29_ORYSJ|nr:hypothetical protein [Oryza sativa Japonica Group]
MEARGGGEGGDASMAGALLPRAAPAMLAPSSCHVDSRVPRWQEDGAKEAGAVPLDDGASHSGAPKRTISGISFSKAHVYFAGRVRLACEEHPV